MPPWQTWHNFCIQDGVQDGRQNKNCYKIIHRLPLRHKTRKEVSILFQSLIRFAAKLLRQCNRYFKLRKAVSKFYCRQGVLVEKYSVSLKTLLEQGKLYIGTRILQ